MTREEAINKVRQMSLPKETMEILQALAPELTESEDEKIRKEIIDYIKSGKPQKCYSKRWIAYLEKQKEQKPVDISESNDNSEMSDVNGHLTGKILVEYGAHAKVRDGKRHCEMGWQEFQRLAHYFYELGKTEKQKPNIELCPHSIKSKSYKENGYPIEDCDYGLEIALSILEKTLGKVQGYQTDDGIREHQTAIKAVKDAMKEQKPEVKYIYPKFRKGDVIEPITPNGSYTPVRVRYINDERYICRSDDDTATLSLPLQMEDEYKIVEQKPAECGASNDESEYDKGYREGHKFGLRQTQEYMLPGGKTFSGLIPCWVNAPSTLQPVHKYHGKNVVIMHENNGGFRCCCIDDEKATTFHLPEDTLFVEGWRRKPAEWSDSFEENIRNLLHDKLTWHSEDGKMSSTVFIDDKTLKDIINGIWFYVGKEVLKYPNKELNVPEWSEEDEKIAKEIEEELWYPGDFPDYPSKEESELYDDCQKRLGWFKNRLKSLRNGIFQNGNTHWKPSEEQMKALEECGECKRCIKQLYEQLKKL